VADPVVSVVGEASYGSFTFSAFCHTTSFQMVPVYDSAGRTVTHTHYRISIKDRINSATNTDANLLDIKRQLLAPAREFVYEEKGAGALSINTGEDGSHRDLAWGPKPTMLSWRPAGGKNTAEFEWSVEFAVVECEDGTDQKALMELCFTVAYDIDKGGYTSRTVSGHLRIPQTRANADARTVQDSADSYYEQVFPTIPDGYRRETRNRKLSEDRCRLDFTFTDMQLPQPLPPGCIDARISYTVQTEMPGNFLRWLATLNGHYEIARDQSPAVAWEHFNTVMRDRARHISLRAHEVNILGKPEVDFTVTLRFTTNFDTIMAASGIWRPVPGANHTQWAASVARVAQPRGLSGFTFRPEDDLIIDLCAPKKPKKVAPRAGALPQLPVQLRVIDFGQVRPEDSWVEWNNRLFIEVIDNNVPMLPLPDRPAQPILRAVPSIDELTKGQKGFTPPYSGEPETHSHQQRAAPTLFVHLMGSAMRAGFDISPPDLTSFAGIKPVPMNRPGEGFLTDANDNVGVPLVRAAWHFRYLVPGTPGKSVSAPQSPFNPKK
jgi:hypothetical protein